jgi:NodT family efflux transporter outer membrane factor (OMF) lipoprotein
MKKLPLLLLAFVAGCAVGPDYQRPSVEAPAEFKEMKGWRAATPGDALPRGDWWAVFGDADLDALMKRVDVSNFNIRAAEARVRQARALADSARAGYFPTIGAGASAARSKSPSLPNAPSTTAAVSTYSASVNASWEIDLWGKVRRAVEAGDATWQASAADLETARLSARASLATSYFTLRLTDGFRQILEDTVAAYERSLVLTRNRYNAGVVARVDVVQAEVQWKSAQAQLIDLGVDRAQLEHAIALLVGEAPADFSIERKPLVVSMPQVPLTLPSALLERRPDIAAAERSVAAANARIGVAKAAYFPTLTLSGAGGFRSTDLGDLFLTPSRFWSLGAALAQPLFDGGARSAASDQAIAAYDEQVALYRQTVLTGFQEAEDNLAALRILADEAGVQDEVVEGARRNVELTLNQYNAGVVSYLNVIVAQASLLQNERTAATLLGRRLTASINLVKAAGGGWSAGDLPHR